MSLITVVSAVLTLGTNQQVIPKVGISTYLTQLKFEGLYVGDINLTKRARPKSKKPIKLVVHSVSLKFFPKPLRGNGLYEMKLGSHLVTGEWNVFDEVWVNLWIDKIDKLEFGTSMSFRAPRFVDDSWVAKDVIGHPEFALPGRLVISNVGDERYWKQKSGRHLLPSRTEIVPELAGR